MQGNEKQLQTTESRPLHTAQSQKVQQVFAPVTDIIESQENYRLSVDMPGVDEKNVDVTLENDVLTIRGHVAPLELPKDAKEAYREYEVGDYRRVFSLTDEVDRDRIEAKVKDGVLHLTLPKGERAKARKITVKAG